MYLKSIKSVKHNAAKSAHRSILKKSRHIGFVVFIVHSSMMPCMQFNATDHCLGWEIKGIVAMAGTWLGGPLLSCVGSIEAKDA